MSKSICQYCENEYSDLTQHYSYYPDHRPKDWDSCQDCGVRYKFLPNHWYQSDCDFKSISKEEKQIITGILMGDGSINKGGENSKNNYLVLTNTNKKYINYIDKKLGVLSSGIHKERNKKERVDKNVKSGFNPSATVENYKNIYRLNTITHPYITQHRSWYEGGKKEFPESIDLTPKTLKHWYVCDGNMNTQRDNRTLNISCSEQYDKRGVVENMFYEKGFNNFSWHTNKINRGPYKGNISARISFYVDDSYNLWEYMGEPVPGFEYKWPEEYR